MILDQPFQVVTPTVDGDVLAALARGDSEFTPGDLHRMIGRHSLSGIRKALARLTTQGIAISMRRGNAQTYRLNRDHLAGAAIIDIASIRDQFIGRLRDSLGTFRHTPIYGALFGSASRGDMRPDSDIDLFLVRPEHLDDGRHEEWDDDVRDLAQRATAWVGNDTRILEMDQSEFADATLAGDPLIDAIRTEGVLLAGSPDFWRTHG